MHPPYQLIDYNLARAGGLVLGYAAINSDKIYQAVRRMETVLRTAIDAQMGERTEDISVFCTPNIFLPAILNLLQAPEGVEILRVKYNRVNKMAFDASDRERNVKEKSMTALTLNLDAIVQLTDDAFYTLCRANPEIQFERTFCGRNLIVMPPTGGETGKRSGDIFGSLWVWNKQQQLGITFDSSTGFKLPNGANRSPDAAWMLLACWEALTPEQRRRFPPVCSRLCGGTALRY